MPATTGRFDAARLQELAGKLPDMGRDPAAVRLRLEMLEKVLERAFIIPGLNRPVGLDSVVGLIPVAGDLITGLMGAYLVWEARNLGMSKFTLLRMAGNVAIDSALGAIPLAGDVFDFFWRSNSKNLRLIKRHLDKHHPAGAVIDARRAG